MPNNKQLNLKKIVDVLDKKYGSPRLGNKQNPLDEAVFIQLSLKTKESSYFKVYEELKVKYPTWDKVLEENDQILINLVEPAGLASLKVQRIKSMLRDIKEKNDDVLSLKFLENYSDRDAEKFLLSLHGVGIKSAKCILLYSLGRAVLPVDTHTYRLALELGLIDATYMRNEKGKLHNILEPLIPPELRFKFHVNAVMHGREEHQNRKLPGGKCVLVRELEEKGLLPLL